MIASSKKQQVMDAFDAYNHDIDENADATSWFAPFARNALSRALDRLLGGATIITNLLS